jgi:cell division protein FtsB
MPLNEEHEKLKQRDMRLADEVAREEALARQQEAYIEDLRKNPRLAEQLAREKLGLARSNETVIRWEAPATNTPSTRP